MGLSLKTFSILSKMVWGLAQPKLERQPWVIASLKGSGFEVLKPDFESIYAHALVEYAYDAYPDEENKTWVDFFSLKETAQYIKAHLYKKPEQELEGKFDGLLHTGQGKEFLALKNIQAQTGDVAREYQKLKKYLDEFTEKSRTPAQAQHLELSQKLLNEVKAIQSSLLSIQPSSLTEAQIIFDDTELRVKISEVETFAQQNQSLLQTILEKLESKSNEQNNWQEWIKALQQVKLQAPEKPQISVQNSKNVIAGSQIGNVSGDFILGDNNKTTNQNAEKIYNINKIDKADFK